MAKPIELCLWIIKAGIVPYEDSWYLQNQLRIARISGRVSDTLILLQHPPVVTLGRGGDKNNLLIRKEELAQHGIDLFTTDRGGDITYHGPGQLIGYPIVALREWGFTVGRYVRQLEEVIIEALKDLRIAGRALPGSIGVWVGEQKIASIGVRVRKGVSTHGFALNVQNDLAPFTYIHPCGTKGMRITSVFEVSKEKVVYEEVEETVARQFLRLFRVKRCVTDVLSSNRAQRLASFTCCE